MKQLLLTLAAAVTISLPASAEPFEGRWRTASMDRGICMRISATEFIDPIAEIRCRVTHTEKTGRNTWTLTAQCDGDDDGYKEAVYLRLLASKRLRVRVGSSGPLLVLQPC